MKPNPHRSAGTQCGTNSTYPHTTSIKERGMHATNARPPPAVPYRGYPSLSDDGQPYFPRLRRTHRPAHETTETDVSVGTDTSPLLSVRMIALSALIVIIAALVASVG